MLLVTYVVPLIIDSFSIDDSARAAGDSIGYVNQSGVTGSLTGIPGHIRMSSLSV
ncbi:MAG: hypothetical protein QF590_01310 [Dehalococcoidia bacterium]|jgi:hypothetical protein|nr:hypothetical protein [Dehalococcoidia bacterium]